MSSGISLPFVTSPLQESRCSKLTQSRKRPHTPHCLHLSCIAGGLSEPRTTAAQPGQRGLGGRGLSSDLFFRAALSPVLDPGRTTARNSPKML